MMSYTLEDFENASPRLNPLQTLSMSARFLLHIEVCHRKFMVVNLGLEKVAVLRQGLSSLKDTNSAAN